MIDEAQGAITCRSSTLAILADSGPFCGLLITVLGSGVISTIEKPRVCYVSVINTQFWLILARFVDYYLLFLGPKVISTTYKPWELLHVGHQHSHFCLILVRFVHYYSPFGAPE